MLFSFLAAGAALAAGTAPVASLLPVAAEGPIVVDGRLDEGDWARATRAGAFVSSLPGEGVPDPGTDARLLYDDHALYVAFTVRTQGPPAAPLSRRDQTLLHDWVGVVLDTYDDGRKAFTFRVTPRGVQADGIYQEADGDLWNVDLSWDGVWTAESTTTPDGYVVEMAIDWRTLRYPRAPDQTWRVLLVHNVPVPWTFSTWPPLDRGVASQLGQAAAFGPFSPPPARSRPEILATILGTWEDAPLDPGVALLEPDANPSVDAGLGLRLGLGSSLTADLALNPDFSQIEADPDQVTVNVKYPLYYDEKRPFFLEGSEVFETPLEVVWSRSIADPLAAGKLSGRAGGVAVGVLSAWDQAPQASTIGVDYATGEALPGWDDGDVEGADAVVNLARGRGDFGEGASFGGLYADKLLVRAEGAPLGNHVGGVDGTVPLGRRWVASGQLLGSQTDFVPEGLGEADSLAGFAWSAKGRWSGERASLKVEQYHLSPGFRAENGFLEEVGRTGARTSGALRWDDVGPFRTVTPKAEASGQVDPEGTVTNAQAGPALRLHGEPAYGELKFLLDRERYLGVDLDGWTAVGFFDVTPRPGAELYVAATAGPEPWYDAPSAATLYQGFAYGFYLDAMVTFGGRLELLYDATARTFGEDYATAPDQTTILQRLRVTYGFSRETSARVIGEWNTYSKTLDSSALLVWERNYGTAAWVGYAQTNGAEGLLGRSLFVKLGVLGRPE